MNVDWIVLANYAEDQNGLLYMAGAGWDTVTAGAPLEGGPPNAFTIMQGTLVVRMRFDTVETDRDHDFTLTLVGEDGEEVAKIEGNIRIARIRGLPIGWPQNVNLVVPVNGIPLPRPGLYRFAFQLNQQHVGEQHFRVLKGY